MRLFSVILFAATAAFTGALQFTNRNFYNITVGQPFNITWTDASGPVSLTLVKVGTPAFSTNAATIASGLTGTNYVWTPSASLLRDVYDIQFDDDLSSIHGFQFELLGGLITATTTATMSATATAAPSYTATFTYP